MDTFLANFKILTLSQKLAVFSLLLLAISLPLGIILTLKPIKPIITPASGPITPTLSPTPTIIGNLPVIITELFPSVQSGKQYRTRLEGYDFDLNDNLSFDVTNIPLGLKLVNCKQNERNIKTADLKVKYLSCDLTGKTSETGEFQTMVILSDGTNKSVKYIKLTVSE